MRIVDTADVVYASRSFRLVDYRCPEAEPKQLLPEGTFRLPTVVFPRRGVFFKHQGARAFLCDANHVLFFDAGEPFRISYPVEGGDDSTFLSISPELLAGIVSGPGAGPEVRTERFPAAYALSDAGLYLAHRALLGRMGRVAPADPLEAEERMIGLVGSAIAVSRRAEEGRRSPVRRETRRAHQDTAAAAMALLAVGPERPIGLERLATAVGVSPFHLCRLFKRETGLSVHRYRNRLRLREALERLMEPATDLTSIALDVGFSSHSHFTDAFRREFGASPSETRRKATVAGLAALRRRLVA